jgi:hypothetical protein
LRHAESMISDNARIRISQAESFVARGSISSAA